jgi:nucleotide-binding universal stress UspA family protein
MKLTTILVPLDGSALAEAALPKAMELADFSGARILLLRAAEAHAHPRAEIGGWEREAAETPAHDRPTEAPVPHPAPGPARPSAWRYDSRFTLKFAEK